MKQRAPIGAENEVVKLNKKEDRTSESRKSIERLEDRPDFVRAYDLRPPHPPHSYEDSDVGRSWDAWNWKQTHPRMALAVEWEALNTISPLRNTNDECSVEECSVGEFSDPEDLGG